MAFRIKDLMINLAPSESEVRGCPGHQTYFKYCGDQVTHVDELCGVQCSKQTTHGEGDCGKETTHPIVGCGKETTHPIVGCGKETTHREGCDDLCTKETHPGPGCDDFCTKETHPEGCGKETTHPGDDPGHDCGYPPYTTRVDAGKAYDELAAIRAQLKAALAEIDEKIERVEETLKPSTIEEVEELEFKLKGALEELEQIKSDLKKK
jgi:hypothetical protein